MLDIMDCLDTDVMAYRDVELLVRQGKYGLGKIKVSAKVNKKSVDVLRLPKSVEINVPSIVTRINIKRAEEGLRPIKQWVIWKSIKGLEREGLVPKIGKKRGMKGQLRAIGSFYVREELVMNPYTDGEMKVVRYGESSFWGSSQRDIKDKLARLEPVK